MSYAFAALLGLVLAALGSELVWFIWAVRRQDPAGFDAIARDILSAVAEAYIPERWRRLCGLS